MRRTTFSQIGLAAVIAIPLAAQASGQSPVEHPMYPAPPHEKQATEVEKNLKVFDVLDFDVFSNQKWSRLEESHAKDIVVTWPDGHETKGLDKHIEDLKAMFVYAPDINIKVHPIRFGSGSWTTATGVMTGTFSNAMPIGDGKSIPPTGNRFALNMVTIGHWRNGTMDHEWLFWDSQDFMKQLGLAK
jgi:predicted ester cyclase